MKTGFENAEKVTVQAPLILAVETSGRAGSVAIAQGPKLIDSIHFTGPMRHSAELFTSINHLLAKAGLDSTGYTAYLYFLWSRQFYRHQNSRNNGKNNEFCQWSQNCGRQYTRCRCRKLTDYSKDNERTSTELRRNNRCQT